MEKHVKFFEKNTKGRDFVVGDIHGCYKEFQDALKRVEFNKSVDRLFSVGDIADRGPDSKKMLELLSEPWFHAVKGNHELMLYDAHTSPDKRNALIFLQNGGEMLPDSTETRKILDNINNLPYIIEIETKKGRKVGIVHAEIPPNISDWELLKKKVIENDKLDEEFNIFNKFVNLELLIWGSHRIGKYRRQSDKKKVYPPISGIDVVYVGHTIVKNPTLYEQHYYLDTGAFLPHWMPENKVKMMEDEGFNPRLTIREIR
jgi:serine/threonine protein phosphatase 1